MEGSDFLLMMFQVMMVKWGLVDCGSEAGRVSGLRSEGIGRGRVWPLLPVVDLEVRVEPLRRPHEAAVKRGQL